MEEAMTHRFTDDSSVSGFNFAVKRNDFSVTMYKLLPRYLEKNGAKGSMNQGEKPDYSKLKYNYEIYKDSHWIFPRIYCKMEDCVLNYLTIDEPAVLIPGATRSTPLESVRSPILVARVSKVGILQGVNTATSGFDEDIAEMYAEKIKGLNGKIAEKSEGMAAVFVKELKLIYSLDIRDALTMVAFTPFVLTRSS